MPDALRLFLWI